MSGARGSARKNKVKIRIKGKFLDRKQKNLYTNMFVKENANLEEVLKQLSNKYPGRSMTIETARDNLGRFLVKKNGVPYLVPVSKADQVNNTRNAVYWFNIALAIASQEIVNVLGTGQEAIEILEKIDKQRVGTNA
jgi:hypothetical protein